MEVISAQKGKHPRMEGCRDYPLFEKVFDESLLDLFEQQLNEYLEMEEVTEDYLRNVPQIVCWFEGMLTTEYLVREYGKEVLGEKADTGASGCIHDETA